MSEILYEVSGAIATITLNRPDHLNAYNVSMHTSLFEAIERADTDPNIRVMIITGAGKMFCAGADISQGFSGGGFGESEDMIDGVRRDLGGVLNLRIFASDTPIIGAVNGHAIGIGATMLLPMDIKIASSAAKFAFPFARRGIVFDGAASFFLPRIVGLAKTQEWLLKGEAFKADEAKDAGFISEIVAPEAVMTRAMELAEDIATHVSPRSVALNKQLLRASIYGDERYGTGAMSAHMAESKLLNESFVGPDCIEGVSSFLQKRPPNFANWDQSQKKV